LRKIAANPESWSAVAALPRPMQNVSSTGCSERKERSIIPRSTLQSKLVMPWIFLSWPTFGNLQFPHANLRHYAFLNQGLADIEEDLQQRQIGFIVRRPPNNSLQVLLAEVNAAIVVAMRIPAVNQSVGGECWRLVCASLIGPSMRMWLFLRLFQKRMYPCISSSRSFMLSCQVFGSPADSQPHQEWKPRMRWIHFLCATMLPRVGPS